MRVSVCFPTLPNLGSENLKKAFFLKKKNETFGHIEDILQKFFNEVPRSEQFLEKLLTVFRQGSWTKFYERVFLWTKEKDSILSLKQNLSQFIWNTLLYCLYSNIYNKAKIWACWLLQGLDCLTFLSLDLLILYNELVMLSFQSFPFIVLFLQVFWSKFTILFKLSSKKINHFWTKVSTLFLCPVSLSSCSLRSHVSENLSIAFFFLFLELSFFLFWYQTGFFECLFRLYVHFLQISLGFQEVATSDFPSCFWLVPFHEGNKMLSKASRRSCKFFAVVYVIGYILYF